MGTFSFSPQDFGFTVNYAGCAAKGKSHWFGLARSILLGSLLNSCTSYLNLPFRVIPNDDVATVGFSVCTSVQLEARDAQTVGTSTVTISLSAQRGKIYANYSDCIKGIETSTISFPATSSEFTFYFRSVEEGSDVISDAQGTEVVRFEVAKIPFNSGTGFDGSVSALTVDVGHDYEVYAAGSFTTYNGTAVSRLVRLHSNGALDTTFETGTGPLGGNVNTIRTSLDGSGSIYIVGGFTSYDGTSINRVARILRNGRLDPSFNIGTGFSSGVQRIALLDDGTNRMYLCGGFTSFNSVTTGGLVRLNFDGSRDMTFVTGTGVSAGCTGITTPRGSAADNAAYLAGGTTTTYQGTLIYNFARIAEDGTLDLTFGRLFGGGSTAYGTSTSFESPKRIYVVGKKATTYNGVARQGITALGSDGAVDGTFDPGTGLGVVGNVIYDVSETSEGKIYAAGDFSTFNGSPAVRALRLFHDGSVDTAFATGTGFDNQTYLAVPLEDGSKRVYYFGPFTAYQGIPVGRIVRLNEDGSLDL